MTCARPHAAKQLDHQRYLGMRGNETGIKAVVDLERESGIRRQSLWHRLARWFLIHPLGNSLRNADVRRVPALQAVGSSLDPFPLVSSRRVEYSDPVLTECTVTTKVPTCSRIRY